MIWRIMKMGTLTEFSDFTDDEVMAIRDCLQKKKKAYEIIRKQNAPPIEAVIAMYLKDVAARVKEITR